MAEELLVSRQTASKYLEMLVGMGIVSKHKLVKDHYYLNIALYQLLDGVGERLRNQGHV